MQPINFYIHIPYCKAKCRYCNFFIVAGRTPELPAYFKALHKEILSYKKDLKNHYVKTVYFGGGTPSLVDAKYIKEIVELIKNNFEISKDLDISIETNPENLTSDKLQTYLDSGISRISIGLQAWQNEMLKYLGRLYTIEEFLQSYDRVIQSGFKNINLDLIFGIPNQTIQNWEESIDNVIKLKPNHISTYSLEVDQESIFGILEKQGRFMRLEEGLDRKMYEIAKEKLQKVGYKHYEISNFAKLGFESKHNLSVWGGEDYLGIGASAHSYFKNQRFNNIYSVEKYAAGVLFNREYKENVINISKKQAIKEYIILHLRLMDGMNLVDFKNKFDCDFKDLFKNEISDLKSKNLVLIDEVSFKLSEKGMDLENTVAMEFV